MAIEDFELTVLMLDCTGRVVLDDATLSALEGCAIVETSGGSRNTGSCNNISCDGSSNQVCSNPGSCAGAVNLYCGS